MECLFCGNTLAVERSLTDRWFMICTQCKFKGPEALSKNGAVAACSRLMDNKENWIYPWARFRAYDRDGKLFEYEHKPEVGDGGYWLTTSGRFLFIRRIDLENWQHSLQKREEAGDEPKK